jgi:hypothetical protein
MPPVCAAVGRFRPTSPAAHGRCRARPQRFTPKRPLSKLPRGRTVLFIHCLPEQGSEAASEQNIQIGAARGQEASKGLSW